MPKISKAEQQFIRSLAKKYVMKLIVSPFNEGLLIYSDTYDSLYIRSARWKFCLKCGEIESTEEMLDEHELKKMGASDRKQAQERVHQCTMGINHFPVLITTSWYKLKDFFMTDKYVKALENAGVKDIPFQKPIFEKVPIKVKAEKARETVMQDSTA